MMAKSAQAAKTLSDAGEGNPEFLKAKLVTASIYMQQVLPRVGTYAAQIGCHDNAVLHMEPEWLAR